MNEETHGTLEGWELDPRGVVWGTLMVDSKGRFKDETYVHTSTVTSDTSNLREGDIITTKNSKYKLGKPLVR